jgi:hypothetical protein
MDVEITPEPTPEERAAILQALARLAATDGRPSTSEWWREGLREAVLDDAE